MVTLIESIPDVILRPLVAVLCAAFLGIDREMRGKPAGLRTQMMVALGTTIFTMAAWNLHEKVASGESGHSVDPARVISGVIGGLGFLGAGSIIQSGGSVYGLTTAATVWVVGAIGICCGQGDFLLAVTATGFSAVILGGLGIFELLLKKGLSEMTREN